MSCNSTNPCSSSCPTTCGCVVQVPGTCVFYQGSNLTCLDVTKGDNYDDILSNINNIVCDLLPPTGSNVYTGQPGEITVVNNIIGLDPAITTLLNTHTTNITNLQTCVSNGVRNITATPGSGLSVTTTSTNSCGRTLNINYTAPAIPLSQKQGIIENVTQDVTITSTPLEYSYDLSPYVLKAGDLVKIKGNILRLHSVGILTGINCGTQTIKLTDTVTTLTYVFSAGSEVCKSNSRTILDFEFYLAVHSVLGGNITFKVYNKSDNFGYVGSNFLITYPEDPFAELANSLNRVTQSDSSSFGSTTFNQSNFKVRFEQTDTSYLRQYIVEIIRKIN